MNENLLEKILKVTPNTNIHLNKNYIIIGNDKQSYRYANNTLKEFFLMCLDNNNFSAEELFNVIIGEENTQKNKKYLERLLEDLIKNNFLSTKKGGIQRNKPRLSGILYGYAPKHISIELTYKCNFNCKYCYASASIDEKRKELNSKEIINYLEKFIKLGTESVEFSGGEPLVKENFYKILDFANRKLKRFSILSNGSNIDKKFLNNIDKYDKITMFSISLDSLNENIFDNLTNTEGNFNKVVNAIKLLRENNYAVRVTSVYTSENYMELLKLAEFSKSVGAYFAFSPVMDFGAGERYAKEKDYEKVDYQKLSNIYEELYKNYRGDTILDLASNPAIKELNNFFNNCGAGYKNLVITPYGDVKPCFLSSETFGNLINENIEDILCNKEMDKWANCEAPKESICKDCKYYTYCNGCIVRGVKTANIYEDCKMKEKFKKFGFLEL